MKKRLVAETKVNETRIAEIAKKNAAAAAALIVKPVKEVEPEAEAEVAEPTEEA